MKAFDCRVCGNPLYFENSVCVACSTPLGFSRAERALVPVDRKGRYVDHAGLVWWVCANLNRSGCTWLAPLQGGQCFACDLTRARPDEVDENYLLAERAKRALVVGLDSLGFPIRTRLEDPEQGLAFDLLSSVGEKPEDVVIGHDRGIITIDLAESDPAYREKIREALAEPYRTMLGHFRHEVGHYFEWQLVVGDLIGKARELFGDETTSYADAIQRHYSEGAPADWRANYISEYATMHPFEDFAETFAHYLHICDTVESAAEYGLATVAPVSAFKQFRDVVTGVWIPLSTALNVINRSMGKDDLYPFVIPAPVLDKLDFVAALPR